MIPIGEGLKPIDIEIAKNRVEIGQTIKFKDVRTIADKEIEGTVIGIYPNHCLVDTGMVKTSVPWIDLIIDKRI